MARRAKDHRCIARHSADLAKFHAAQAARIDTTITAPGPVKIKSAGMTSRHPIPAPSRSAKYNLLTWDENCCNASETHRPPKKKGMATTRYTCERYRKLLVEKLGTNRVCNSMTRATTVVKEKARAETAIRLSVFSRDRAGAKR